MITRPRRVVPVTVTPRACHTVPVGSQDVTEVSPARPSSDGAVAQCTPQLGQHFSAMPDVLRRLSGLGTNGTLPSPMNEVYNITGNCLARTRTHGPYGQLLFPLYPSPETPLENSHQSFIDILPQPLSPASSTSRGGLILRPT